MEAGLIEIVIQQTLFVYRQWRHRLGEIFQLFIIKIMGHSKIPHKLNIFLLFINK